MNFQKIGEDLWKEKKPFFLYDSFWNQLIQGPTVKNEKSPGRNQGFKHSAVTLSVQAPLSFLGCYLFGCMPFGSKLIALCQHVIPIFGVFNWWNMFEETNVDNKKRRNTMVRILAFFTVALILVGCASHPVPRPVYTDLPPLENGWSRVKITSGKLNWARLWTTEQLGPVFINDQHVWDAAKDEYIIIDLLPGSYELSWTPRASDKVYTEKRQFTFKAGETRHFACDQAQKGAGMSFGLIGALASEYLTKTYLEERPMDNPNSTLVDYKIFNTE